MATKAPITVAYCIGPARLGKTPHTLKPAHYSAAPPKTHKEAMPAAAKIRIDGIDVYISWPSLDTKQTVSLRDRILDQGLDIVKTETLRSHNGNAGYSLSQGQ